MFPGLPPHVSCPTVSAFMLFNHPAATRAASLFLGLVLAATLAYDVAFHWHFISLPGAQELHEAAIPLTTKLLLEGGSPYVLSSLPNHTNVYGVLYNYVLLPFAAIWGPTYALHRAANFIFLWAGSAVVFLALRRSGASRWLAAVGGIFYYLINLATYVVVARPDALGNLFFLLTLWWAQRERPSTRDLALSAVAGMLAFYTKPYFVFGLGLVSVHLFLFESKSRGVAYAAGAGALLAVSAVVVQFSAPLYFFSTFTIHQEMFKSQPGYFLRQAVDFATLVAGFLPLALVAAFLAWKKRPAQLALGLRDLQAPLCPGWRIDIWAVALVGGLLVDALVLGHHVGAFRIYWAQLAMPPLVIVAVRMIASAKSAAWATAGRLLLAFNALVLLTWARLPWPYDPTPFWQYWAKLTAGQPRELLPNILLDPNDSPETLMVHNSQSIYFNIVANRRYPADHPYHLAADKYLADLLVLLNARYFDIIVTPPDILSDLQDSFLLPNYHPHRVKVPCYFAQHAYPEAYGQYEYPSTVWVRLPGPAHASMIPATP